MAIDCMAAIGILIGLAVGGVAAGQGGAAAPPGPGGEGAAAARQGAGAPASMPAGQAGCGPVILNPRVTCDRWPSHYDAASWIEDVWRIENARTGEQKTLALYKWVRLQQHWGDQCHDGTRGTDVVECDAIKKINIYPYGECSDFGVTAAALGHAGGLKAQEAHVPEHTQLEVSYQDADGVERWHRLDPFWGVVVYDKTGSHIATWQEIKADPNVALQPAKTVLPWGDKVTDRKRFAEKGACEPSRRVRPSVYTMDKPLYAGEVYTLSWQRDPQVPFRNASPQARDSMSLWGFLRYQYAQGDPAKLAFGHELLRPHAEAINGQIQIRHAHGTLVFEPVLDAPFADGLYAPAVNVAVGTANQPKLHPAKAGAPAELIYLVQTPYVIADAQLAGVFRAGRADTVRVSIALADWRERGYTVEQVVPNEPRWKMVWQAAADGPQRMDLREADLPLRGEYKFLVKVEMTAGQEPAAVGVDALAFRVTFQEGVMALPRLLPGVNTIGVRASQMRPGYGLRVTYTWDDSQGEGRRATRTLARTPGRIEIRAAGTQPGDVRTRSLTLEAVRVQG